MLESKLDKNLHWKSPAELKSMGYWRDDIGQIRRSKDNALICAISGRAHFHHLAPYYDYDNKTSTVDLYFVDEDCLKELYEMAKSQTKAVLSSGKARLVNRGLKLAAEFLFSLAFKKLGGFFK